MVFFTPAFLVVVVNLPLFQLSKPGNPTSFQGSEQLRHARYLLAESEAKLHVAIELNKRCFLFEIVIDARLEVAECRIRVELLTILEVRNQQLRSELRSQPVSKDNVQRLRQEIEKVQSMLRQMEK